MTLISRFLTRHKTHTHNMLVQTGFTWDRWNELWILILLGRFKRTVTGLIINSTSNVPMNQVSYFLDLVLRGTFLVKHDNLPNVYFVPLTWGSGSPEVVTTTHMMLDWREGSSPSETDSNGDWYPREASKGWRCHWVVGVLHPHQLWTPGGVIWRSHTAKTYPRTSSS